MYTLQTANYRLKFLSLFHIFQYPQNDCFIDFIESELVDSLSKYGADIQYMYNLSNICTT